MRRFATIIASAALISISPTAIATAATHARHGHKGTAGCPPKHEAVLAADAQAIVYKAPTLPESLGGDIFACSYSNKHSFRLGSEPYGGPSGSGGVLQIALAGPVVAYGVEESYTGPSGHSFSEIWVRNLVTGRVIHRMPNGSPPEPGDIGLGGTLAIIVKSDGSVAWIVGASEQLGHLQVRSVDKTGSHLLAASPEIEPDSLALAGSTLYWMQGGKPMSAMLD